MKYSKPATSITQQMARWQAKGLTITDIQAALGISQLARVPEFLARRRAIAARYDEMLAGLPLTLP